MQNKDPDKRYQLAIYNVPYDTSYRGNYAVWQGFKHLHTFIMEQNAQIKELEGQLADKRAVFDAVTEHSSTAIRELRDRVKELEAAIRKHEETFPDEALDSERELWATL